MKGPGLKRTAWSPEQVRERLLAKGKGIGRESYIRRARG